MVALSNKSLFIALIYAACSAVAVPSPHFSTFHATHRTREVGSSGLKVTSYNPKASFETFGAGVELDIPLSKRAGLSLKDIASSYVHKKIGCDPSELKWKSGYTHSLGQVAYFRQSHDGIEIANSVINVAFKNDKATSFSSSFTKPTKIASKVPTISLDAAVAAAQSKLEATLVSSVDPKIEYFLKEDGSAVLTHVFQVSDEKTFKFYQAYVNAHSGELESIVDYVNDATFKAVPIQRNSIDEGAIEITDPEDTFASPQGWITSQETLGNNAVAYVGDIKNTTKASSNDEFIYQLDKKSDPIQGRNPDVARTNAFYIVNSLHDIFYRYGFTEDAFNFQQDNANRGGTGGDRVQISVQDNEGLDNARFFTPPDGQNGVMQMFIFTSTDPRRDGALANDIVTHEMTHGLTNRMTGGGSAECLKATEGGGLGEGWSDAFSDWVENQSGTIEDFATGKYVLDNQVGIRMFPYSVNKTTNPFMYSDAGSAGEVHAIGEIWANMLHVLLHDLVESEGFSEKAFTDVDGTEGNVVFAHIVIDALALQPCQPTFVSARDAIIQADVNRYDGDHECIIWNAFASRGLGVKAGDFKDDESVPAECQGQSPVASASVSGSVGVEATVTSSRAVKPTASNIVKPTTSAKQAQPTQEKRGMWSWFA